jgi:hypothetical protein
VFGQISRRNVYYFHYGSWYCGEKKYEAGHHGGKTSVIVGGPKFNLRTFGIYRVPFLLLLLIRWNIGFGFPVLMKYVEKSTYSGFGPQSLP